MKKFTILIFCIITTSSFSQNYTSDDICKTNKVYFFGYDFTNFKLMDPKIVKDENMKRVVFEIIDIMNYKRDAINYSKLLKKDSVIFVQKIVNDLNAKTNQQDLIGSEIDFRPYSIPKDSLQNMVNRYDTKGMTGIGLVQIIECFYKRKKETTIWFVFFDIASKKILDSYETTNQYADSYHGLAAYWAVGVNYGLKAYLPEHYLKMRKACKKKYN